MTEMVRNQGDAILQVRQLNLHFPGSRGVLRKTGPLVRAVDDVSFDVMRGETFGIVGESGSGKTTLGRAIMRILEPTSGQITLRLKEADPVELFGKTPKEMRPIWRAVRMVFQDPQSSLNPRLRVVDLVGQCLRQSYGMSREAVTQRVGDLLEQVGLRREFLMRYPNAFSGGQRQRLGIARALATNPELVIADEAVSALDVSIQAQTLNLMQDLQEKFDLTYVFIAHDLAVVEHVCDRIAVMYLGQIVELADRDTLFKAPKHPYTRALLDAVPRPDPRGREDRKRVIRLDEARPGGQGCKFAPRCPHAQDLCTSAAPPVVHVGGADVKCHFAGQI